MHIVASTLACPPTGLAVTISNCLSCSALFQPSFCMSSVLFRLSRYCLAANYLTLMSLVLSTLSQTQSPTSNGHPLFISHLFGNGLPALTALTASLIAARFSHGKSRTVSSQAAGCLQFKLKHVRPSAYNKPSFINGGAELLPTGF